MLKNVWSPFPTGTHSERKEFAPQWQTPSFRGRPFIQESKQEVIKVNPLVEMMEKLSSVPILLEQVENEFREIQQ